jgi:hypothetical protein
MDPDIRSFAQVAVVIVGLVGSLSFIGVVAIRSLNLMNRKKAPAQQLDDQRLELLQQSVDAIALEVERIAEAQRFSARLLSEREEVPKLR